MISTPSQLVVGGLFEGSFRVYVTSMHVEWTA
jgi:hypothetical protein